MKHFQWVVLAWCCVCAFCDTPENNGQCNVPQEPVDDSVLEDASLSLANLVRKYGYPVETHTIQTEDGYILSVYRIPHGKNCGPRNEQKVPVLLMHGLLSSAYDFLILGPRKSLGYALADNCYDVWLGNNRGNSESRKHITMKPSQKEFWNFSWHEFGKYDLPAIIDYILSTTNQSSLHYVGHSQGTTQFFVFGALHPEYHHKIRTMQALSPVAFMGNLKSPIVRILVMFQKSIETVAELVGIHEFLPQLKFINLLGSEMCKSDHPHLQDICCNVFFLLCGYDPPQLNRTILPAIVAHTPASSSTRQFIHYGQLITSHKFRHYDYGWLKNLNVYKSIQPPEYDVTKINVPIALYYGVNDWLASLKDVATLSKKLPNIIDKYEVPYSTFNHLDFIFATDIRHLVYNRVLKSLAKY